MFDWVLDVPLIPAQIGDATAKSKFRNSLIQRLALREKCPYSELFWSAFSPNAGKFGPK